jgi:nicotinamidase/pyrazinamidase
MKRFVIVVDTQADFMRAEGALPVPGAPALVAPMQEWLAELSPVDTAGVLFTFDTHCEGSYRGSAEAEQFPVHCVRGSAGWDNVLDAARLDPAIPAYRLEKGVFDMWAETDVEVEALATGARTSRDPFFAELRASGVTAVAVIGVAADYCVRWAVEGLLARGFLVDLPAALTRGIARPIEQVVQEDFAGAPVRLETAA